MENNIVFNKSGVTVTKVQAARLSKAKYTYTVFGYGTVEAGYLRKSDAIVAANALISKNN